MFYRFFYKPEVSQQIGLTKMAAVNKETIEARFSLFLRLVVMFQACWMRNWKRGTEKRALGTTTLQFQNSER